MRAVWDKVQVRLDDRFMNRNSHFDEMTQWCDESCNGSWCFNIDFDQYLGKTFYFVIFEFYEPSDAVMFKLRGG